MCRLIHLTFAGLATLMAAPLPTIAASSAVTTEPAHPGCERATPRQCVVRAIAVMGGAEKLAGIQSEQLEIIEHRSLAEQLPVYALDLNLPILERMVAAPHTLQPDDLQTHPAPAHWITVAGRRQIGNGPNRVALYPLRGASTGRQYMIYFPTHKVLYASDTVVLESSDRLYNPELMHEVKQAVDREHLQVETVYAMHQGPVPWNQVTALVAAAMSESTMK